MRLEIYSQVANRRGDVSRRELGVQAQFSSRSRDVIYDVTGMSEMPQDVTGMSQMSHDVREEFLECHMTSNDVREEYYIIVLMGRCVNKPVQTESGGCYENTFISKFAQLC